MNNIEIILSLLYIAPLIFIVAAGMLALINRNFSNWAEITTYGSVVAYFAAAIFPVVNLIFAVVTITVLLEDWLFKPIHKD